MFPENKNRNIKNEYDILLIFMLMGTVITGVFLFKVSSFVAVKSFDLLMLATVSSF